MLGYNFGHQGTGKTPRDFLSGEDGIRPGEVSKNKPTGVSIAEINNGVKQHHVLPPVAVWERGRWFEDLSKDAQEGIQSGGTYSKIDAIDIHEAWVVPGEGTPGNWLLRVYIVPRKVAANQLCPHPMEWTKFQREKGNNNSPTYTSGYGFGAAPAVTPPTPPKPPPLPSGIHFRCGQCGHWFASDTKFAGHSTHCCPGSSNWDEVYGSDWVIECECCDTLDEMTVCRDGFPRQKKEPVEDLADDKEKEVVPA